MSANLCPYAHQLCADLDRCKYTPSDVRDWWEEAKRRHPLNPAASEAQVRVARYEQVQTRARKCTLARPFMTETPPEQRALL